MRPVARLYVHFPLCRRRCPFCAFNVATEDAAWRPRWKETVLQGLREHALAPLRSLYLGGGTPSLAHPLEEVAPIVGAVPLEPGAEVTLEVNPSSEHWAAEDRLRAFRDAGITRVSVGVQSLDNATLARLGRDHTAPEALAALEAAARVFGPDAVSADLMVWRQTPGELAREMATLASLAHHLSIYELTLEPGTPFHRAHAKGGLPMPTTEEQAELYEAVLESAESRNWHRYEVSSLAKHRRNESRHNWAYWLGEPFLGLGPGAHSRLRSHDDGRLYERVEEPGVLAWSQGAPHARLRPLSGLQERRELVMSALRTRTGISAHQRQWAAPCIDGAVQTQLQEAGLLLTTQSGGLVATRAGLPVLDALLARLLR